MAYIPGFIIAVAIAIRENFLWETMCDLFAGHISAYFDL